MAHTWMSHARGPVIFGLIEPCFPSHRRSLSQPGQVDDVPAVLLVAGTDNDAICPLPLKQTGLDRKRGVDILAREFDAVWKANGGDETYVAVAAAAATAAAAAAAATAAAASSVAASPAASKSGPEKPVGAPVDRYFRVAVKSKRKDGSSTISGQWYAHFQGQKVRVHVLLAGPCSGCCAACLCGVRCR